MKFSFVHRVADDYIVNVVYVEADKDKYYRKKDEEKRQELIKLADIKVATGNSLVNIHFSPCNKNYDSAEIMLYFEDNLMAKYAVPKEQFFKSIDGLAYGRYSFILKQYDKDGNILFETDKMAFNVSKPSSWSRPTYYLNA